MKKNLSDKEATFEQILTVTENLIQENGYNGFSYADIAHLMQLKKASIHYHFPSKEKLVETVLCRYCELFQAKFILIDKENKFFKDKLTAYINMYLETYANDQKICVCAILGAEFKTLPESLQKKVDEFFHLNLHWLTNLCASHADTYTLGSPSQNAQFLLSSLEGSMVVGRGRNDALSPVLVAQTLLNIFH